MRKILLILTAVLISMAANAQYYTLHRASADVKVERGYKVFPAQIGMKLQASDFVVIPEGGKVEILNERDHRIYSSLRTGKVTVSKLMIEAREVAQSNSESVDSKLKFGGRPLDSKKKVYAEKGMVTRRLEVCDSTACDSVPCHIALPLPADTIPTDSIRTVRN